MAATPPTEEGGLFSTATRLFKTVCDAVENRLELFLIELKEERLKLFAVLLLAAAGVVCLLMTLVMVTLTVVVIFWDTHRLLVLSLATAAYAGMAVAAFIALRVRLQRWQAFSATLDQIKKDRSCFGKTN
jgi:uncharacterized membrane protein YqjE